jgi:hypothetical protein
MTNLTGRDVQCNLRPVAHAIAQQELEGLKVTPSTVANLHRAARDEIDTNEVIRNIRRRLQNVRYSGSDPYLDPATGSAFERQRQHLPEAHGR